MKWLPPPLPPRRRRHAAPLRLPPLAARRAASADLSLPLSLSLSLPRTRRGIRKTSGRQSNLHIFPRRLCKIRILASSSSAMVRAGCRRCSGAFSAGLSYPFMNAGRARRRDSPTAASRRSRTHWRRKTARRGVALPQRPSASPRPELGAEGGRSLAGDPGESSAAASLIVRRRRRRRVGVEVAPRGRSEPRLAGRAPRPSVLRGRWGCGRIDADLRLT